MNATNPPKPIHWYRTPIDRVALRALTQRSDRKGFIQAGGHTLLLVVTGTTAWFSLATQSWLVAVAVLFVHGTCYGFILNAVHELAHGSVFRTRIYNQFFLNLFSFLGWYNHVHFWASHKRHHRYTLHPPHDLEVVLPVQLPLKRFLGFAIVAPVEFYQTLKAFSRLSLGRLEGEWEHRVFPETAADERNRLFRFARMTIAGHAAIVVVSLAAGWWWLPLITTLAPFYGGWLLFLCNHTQHAGLQDNVSDFRLCCRTVRLHPVVEFLYWHMNFHIEHHMYTAVPCYNLGKLHALISYDLPPTPIGLISAWRGIIAVLRKQKQDPAYQYVIALPARATSDTPECSPGSDRASATP